MYNFIGKLIEIIW